jgi:hypothetical protein
VKIIQKEKKLEKSLNVIGPQINANTKYCLRQWNHLQILAKNLTMLHCALIIVS